MIDPKPLWNFDDPKSSQLKFEQLAEAATDIKDKAILLTQVARALGLQGEHQKGLDLLDSITSNSPEVQAFIHIERGRIYRSSGEIAKAKPEFEIAAELSRANHMDELHIDALHMIALVLPLEEQVTFTIKVIALAKASKSEAARNWVASLLNNLGMTYTNLGNWDSALSCFKEALEERKRIGEQSRIFVARYMIGWTLRNLNRNHEALDYQESLLQDLTEAGQSDEYVSKEIEILKQLLEN